MPDTPISGLPAATALDRTEVMPIVQSSTTKKAALSLVTAMPSIQHASATLALALTHAGKRIEITVDCTVTIPAYASVAFPDDTEIVLVPFSDAIVTVEHALGASYIVAPFGSVSSNGDGAEMQLRKRAQAVAADKWVVQQ